MRQAIESANLKSTDVDYINAHGTSTAMNDKFETDAIKGVFGEGAHAVAISSTKSMTGHLLGAAGGLEAGVSALVLQHQIIPPTINLENSDPECDLDYTPGTARQASIEVAMSNSFGFGGHNSVLIYTAVDH